MKCADCGEEILYKNPDKCPYCGSTNLVSVEEMIPAVTVEIERLKYEEIEMWDKAEECRKLNMGKVSAISMECPHCGKTQPLSSKDSLVKCRSCGKSFGVPKKVLDLL